LRPGQTHPIVALLLACLALPAAAQQQPAATEPAAPGQELAAEDAEPAETGEPEAPPKRPTLELLELARGSDTLQLSLRLDGAFDEKILAKLESGLELRFRHQVEVRRHRTLWFPRVLASKKIVTSAALDTLTGNYTLRRTVNGGIVETLTTSDVEEMREFMTLLQEIRLELPEDAVLDRRSEARARSHLETRFFLLIFPLAFDTDWERWPLAGLAVEEEDDAG
jgi:hypothetical protein